MKNDIIIFFCFRLFQPFRLPQHQKSSNRINRASKNVRATANFNCCGSPFIFVYSDAIFDRQNLISVSSAEQCGEDNFLLLENRSSIFCLMTHTFVAFQWLILISFLLLHVSSFESMLPLSVVADGVCIINFHCVFVRLWF